MPAYTKQLEDANGDTLYPITVAGSVTDTDGVDLQTRVNAGVFVGAGTPDTPTPYVDTADIVDEAVTAPKINLNTYASAIDQTIDFGTMRVILGQKDITVPFSNSNISTEVGINMPSSFANANFLVVGITKDSGTGYAMATYRTKITSSGSFGVTFLRPAAVTGNYTTTYNYIAIGQKPS